MITVDYMVADWDDADAWNDLTFVYTGEQSSTSANFRINLFSIGLGIAFYL